MSYHVTSPRRPLGFGEDLNLDPYAGTPCKSVTLSQAVTGTTGSGQLCYTAGSCGDVNALRQALQDLGFGPITASTSLTSAGGPLAKAAAKYGKSYTAGASPSADLCYEILRAWRSPTSGAAATATKSLVSTTLSFVKPGTTKATCVGECLTWNDTEKKCYTLTTGKCAPSSSLTQRPRTSGGGTSPSSGQVPVIETPMLDEPMQDSSWCTSQGGTWDPANSSCVMPMSPEFGQAVDKGVTTLKYIIIGGAVVAAAGIGAIVYFATRKPKAKANAKRGYVSSKRRRPASTKAIRRRRYQVLLQNLRSGKWKIIGTFGLKRTATKFASDRLFKFPDRNQHLKVVDTNGWYVAAKYRTADLFAGQSRKDWLVAHKETERW